MYYSRHFAKPMLYVRPSFEYVTNAPVSTEVGCVPEAWEQGRLFCKVSFRELALYALQMCLLWCVGADLGACQRNNLTLTASLLFQLKS